MGYAVRTATVQEGSESDSPCQEARQSLAALTGHVEQSTGCTATACCLLEALLLLPPRHCVHAV